MTSKNLLSLYYYAYSPSSRAVLAVANTLGLKPNIVRVNPHKGEHHKEDFRKVSPASSLPALDDNGFVLFESRAMMKYLVVKFQPDSPLYPKDLQKQALVDQFLYFDCGTLNPAYRNLIAPVLQSEDPPEEAIDVYTEKLEILELILGEKKFLTGDELTLADISIAAEFPNLKNVRNDLLTPKITDYQTRVHEACPELKELNDIIVG